MKKYGLLTVWRSDIRLLFWFCAVWSCIQFGMCVIEFVHWDNFSMPSAMPFAYFMLIFLYVLRKEADRWLKRQWKKRKGEYFIVSWWCAMLIMFVVQFESHAHFRVPDRMVETCIFVLIPYAVTAISKILHSRCVRSHNGFTDQTIHEFLHSDRR